MSDRIAIYTGSPKSHGTPSARLGAILQQMGLSPSSLSQSGDVSLRTLTSTALQLDIRNTSDTSYLLGMQKLSQELMSAADARKVEQKAYSQMVSKTKTAVNKTEALRRALQSLNEQTTWQAPEMENKSKQAGFLQSKSKEYKQHIQQYKTQLGRSGLQPHYRHEELCRKYEELQNLEDKLIPLRSKLHSYKDLPPDLSLAKVKIEESRQQLVALEKELSKHIDMSHM